MTEHSPSHDNWHPRNDGFKAFVNEASYQAGLIEHIGDTIHKLHVSALAHLNDLRHLHEQLKSGYASEAEIEQRLSTDGYEQHQITIFLSFHGLIASASSAG